MMGFVQAIQKNAENYDRRTGGKLELRALKLYLMGKYGRDRVDALFWDIQMVILRSLLAVQQVTNTPTLPFPLSVNIASSVSPCSPQIIIHDRHCFELYGYDIMIDENLKPWLLEVNASPSLTANTPEDYALKCDMLNGVLDVVDLEGQLQGDEEHVSGWDLLYDNGYIEIDPSQCGYTTFLGSKIPVTEEDEEENDGDEQEPHA